MAHKDSSEGRCIRTGLPGGGNENFKGPGGSKKFLSPDSGTTSLEKSSSVQKIHQQSSTETSGLGETITSGFSSQESIRSTHSFNEKLGRCAVGSDVGADNTDQFGISPATKGTTSMKDRTDTKPLIHRSGAGESGRKERQRKDPRKERGGTTSQVCDNRQGNEKVNMYPDGTNFDELFSNPGAKTQANFSVAQIDHNDRRASNVSDRHDTLRGSVRSNLSRSGSYRSKSGSRNFLGTTTESAWTTWSKARRASFRRRLELPEKPCRETQERASTPIKKAREEGLMFIHEDLKGNYISEEDINYIRRHRLQQYKTYHVIEKSKRKSRNFPGRSDINLSVRDWTVLSEYWQHSVFYKCRFAAFFFALLSIVCLIISVTNSYWIIYTLTHPVGGELITVQEGLWTRCTFNAQNVTCDTIGTDWQKAVIGLMIFSSSFGFVATILAILGVCTSPLPKKIYYFHSAGEIFLVCAFSVGAALIIYPTAMEMSENVLSHYYGAGYGLGWGGAFFFLVAALCMTLDEIVRESSRAKCCKLCFASRRTQRAELQNV